MTSHHLVLFFDNFAGPDAIKRCDFKEFGRREPTGRKDEKIQCNQEKQELMAQKKKIVIEEDRDMQATEDPSTPATPARPESSETSPAEAADPIDDLQADLAAAQAEAKDNHDRMLRMAAELENVKKRAARELDDLRKFATENLIRQLLTVVDNLERAVASAAPEDQSGNGLLDGVVLTLAEVNKILERHHVRPITALGEPFDPAFHQAMSQEENAEYPSNTVVQEYQKGYLMHDRLLRPAMVVVSKASPSGNSAEKKVDTNA